MLMHVFVEEIRLKVSFLSCYSVLKFTKITTAELDCNAVGNSQWSLSLNMNLNSAEYFSKNYI